MFKNDSDDGEELVSNLVFDVCTASLQIIKVVSELVFLGPQRACEPVHQVLHMRLR